MSEEKMVPQSVAAQMLTTGFEWEAGLFIETYKILKERLSKEEAREILGKAMYRAGVQLGMEAHKFTDKRGPIGMAEAWDGIYGMGSDIADVLKEDEFNVSVTGCPAFEVLKRFADLPEDELHFIGQAYCAGDAGQAKGFDSKMHFQHTCRLLVGDDKCTWIYTTGPQDAADSAVPDNDFNS